MTKRILISGVNGFVGTNLVKSLSNSYLLTGLDIVFVDQQGLEKTIGWDDLYGIKDFDVIIHLAGKAHDTRNQAKREEYFAINTGLTKKIFDYYLKSNAKKFIFFSSVKAAASKVDGVLTEDVVPKPMGPYAESKLAAESYILSAFNGFSNPYLFKEYQVSESLSDLHSSISAKSLYILRPCMIHGPGNKGNLSILAKMVKNGIPYPLGAYENKRSFTSIDNLSFVINELVSKNIPSGIYNMADDETVSSNNLVKLISEVAGKKEKIWMTNKLLVNGLALTGSALHLPFNKDSLQKLTENYVVSNAKLKRTLNISRMPVNSIDGLRKTLTEIVGK